MGETVTEPSSYRRCARDAGPAFAAAPAPPGTPRSMHPDRRSSIPSCGRLNKLLTRHLSTVQHVADELGCSRRQAQRWLERYNLNADNFRGALS